MFYCWPRLLPFAIFKDVRPLKKLCQIRIPFKGNLLIWNILLCSFVLAFLVGCSQNRGVVSATSFESNSRPTIALKPMEDLVGTPLSSKVAVAFSEAIHKRLSQKQLLGFARNTRGIKEFEVTMQLMQQEEAVQSPSEMSIGIHLKIVDLRSEKPRIVLQEILRITTLLEKPFYAFGESDLQGDQFSVSPLGMAQSKLSRDIATRIEDYILLAQKGK